MTREEFKQRWESNERGGGITFDDIAKCAKDWGLFARPKCCKIEWVRYAVLIAAECEDADEYAPNDDENITIF